MLNPTDHESTGTYTVRLNAQGRLELLCPRQHRMYISGASANQVYWYCQECRGEESTKYRSITLLEAFDALGDGRGDPLLALARFFDTTVDVVRARLEHVARVHRFDGQGGRK
jgi:hypothetical protein